jgi:hypothetical protein
VKPIGKEMARRPAMLKGIVKLAPMGGASGVSDANVAGGEVIDGRMTASTSPIAVDIWAL